MTDLKTFCGGAALIALVPALLFWQSSNTSKGTSNGISQYNVDHLGSIVTEYLYIGKPQALDLLCNYALDRDGNGIYAATWIDHIAARCGECADVHAARGRLAAFVGDRQQMQREFAAALAAARDEEEIERIRAIVGRHRE